jgi:hypothetical protein
MTAILLALALCQSMSCGPSHCSQSTLGTEICNAQCTMPDGKLKTCYTTCSTNPNTGSKSCTTSCH